MPTNTPYITPIDSDVYAQLLDILGLTPQMEAIDVRSTVQSIDQLSDHESPGRLGFALGAGAGYLRQGLRKVTRVFGRTEVKTAALIAHWTTWTVLVAVMMAMATSFWQLLIIFIPYLYLTNIMFEAALRL